MHSENIMHRDLKPENIMFKNSYDTLKIVDFGLSTSQNVQKYIHPKCGTPGYVAPEIANLADLDLKYDKICERIFFKARIIMKFLEKTKNVFSILTFWKQQWYHML